MKRDSLTLLEPRQCAAPGCVRKFMPRSSFHRACSQRCAMKLVKVDKKAQKANDRQRREKMKSISQLGKECRTIVQAIARIRDRNDGCISCHLPATWGGQWHGSHFRPAGNNSAVQFSLWNIHKSCSPCNAHKGGNLTAYEPRLVAKIGQEKVDWLKSQTQVVKYAREYLMRFKKVMGKRLRRLARRV